MLQSNDATLHDLNAAVSAVSAHNRISFDSRHEFSPGVYDWIDRKCRADGFHEPATLAAFLYAKEHTPFRHVFDCGALFGYFGLWAQQLDPNVQITSFDAHPGSIPILQANLPRSKVIYAALSDVSGEPRRIWISGFNLFEEPEGGWEDLANDAAAMKPRGENNRGSGFIYIPLVTIDAYCKAEGVAPDLIKIDVEAYQAHAIRGALDTMEAHKPIVVIELHDPEKIARMGTTNKDTVQPLYDLGYNGYWCGNFRDADARFERVDAMTDRYEKLSIMAFVP